MFINPFADVEQLTHLVKATIDHCCQVANLPIGMGLQLFEADGNVRGSRQWRRRLEQLPELLMR